MKAVKYFHFKGIAHRDLKLDNIMLIGTESIDERDLRVKLIDFGLSNFTKNGNTIMKMYS